MLDLSKLRVQLGMQNFLENKSKQIQLALQLWQQVILDLDLPTKLAGADLPWSIPTWSGALGLSSTVDLADFANYTVVAADGSQIYPDRHSGMNCYVINTGTVVLRYADRSSVKFNNTPYFYQNDTEQERSVDLIDALRSEKELADGLQVVQNEFPVAQHILYLIDGSIIPWHLMDQTVEFYQRFMPTYLQQLNFFYQQQIPVVGYISLPNSKDLLNVLRAELGNFKISAKDQNLHLNLLVDADFLLHTLKPLQFTNWFKSELKIAKGMPESLQVYFAYFHTGFEIARIEVPSWLMQNPELLSLAKKIITDQNCKGYGYPTVLAEAHQQAVIKSAEKELFYKILRRLSHSDEYLSLQASCKSKQKRIMYV